MRSYDADSIYFSIGDMKYMHETGKIKGIYDISFTMVQLLGLADENISYNHNRFAMEWLKEMDLNTSDFVHFVAGNVDAYDRIADENNRVCLMDDDLNVMYGWDGEEWISKGIIKDYPKFSGEYTITADRVYVTIGLSVDIDTKALKSELENARCDRMATFDKGDVKADKPVNKERV